MRAVETLEEFIEINRKKNSIIYGAGWGGKVVFRYMKTNGLKVTAFAVTDANRAGESYNDVPVYCLDDILKMFPDRNMHFILAVTRQNQPPMEEELKRRGVTCCMLLSDALLHVMARENGRFTAREAQKAKKINTAQGKEKKAEKTVGFLVPGYLDTNYAEERLIIGKIEGAAYTAIPKETILLPCIGTKYERDLELHRKLEEACYCPVEYVPEVDIIHTFNAVCKTDQMWCMSFETSAPRLRVETEEDRDYFLRLADCMKKPNCKRLYALCRNAYEIQKYILSSRLTPEDVELIMEKTAVLHPPQKTLVSEREFEQKHHTDKIHFIFIGGAFFIKGGREMLQVLSEIEGVYDFKLTLISALLYDDYFTHTSYDEMVECRNFIKDKAWIDYYEVLPNEEVLEKCKQANVGMLPSVADTYGYSVLEMQAAGCPVITTNIRAFPEINSAECGWICRLPVNELRFCTVRDTKDWSPILQGELRRCFQEIFRHPEIIREKGRMAMERIRRMHDPYRYQERLKRDLFSDV